MNNILLKDVLKRKNYDDTPRKTRWKNSVLLDNYETTKRVEDTLSGSKASRKNIEKSLEATRAVIDRYEGFQKEYKNAVKRLSQRIESNEREILAAELEENSYNSVSDDSNNLSAIIPSSLPCLEKNKSKIHRFFKNNPQLARTSPRTRKTSPIPDNRLRPFRF